MSTYNDNTVRREAFVIKHSLDYRSLNIQRNYRNSCKREIREIPAKEKLEI
jgi:hypothetical protein